MNPNIIPLLERLGVPVDFPQFFPTPIEGYRRTLAEEFVTQDDFAIAAMLATAATAIGGNVSAQVSDAWRVRPNLFIATVGYKGSGKTPLAKAVTAPLLDHEESLARKREAELGVSPTDHGHEDEGSNMFDDFFSSPFADGDVETFRREPAPPPPPRVVLNDCTIAAILDQLELGPRQLLIHSDELSKLFIRGKDGTDRQTLCELADGTSLLRSRGSRGKLRLERRIADPYTCLFGGFTPDLFSSTAYGRRGDDGLLDRFLLVGLLQTPHAKWPNSVHDPELATAWKSNVKRLLNIERLASDAADGRINVGIEPGATAVFEKFTTRMIALASAINLPESQRGIIRKMMHHAARLALIHRCLRWSSGEFSASGPLGKIDEQDAEAGAEAAMVFLGRWIIWRPELAENLNAPTHVFGLERDPGNDPALQVLAAMAAASHVGIGRIEQLIRYLRRLSRPVRLAELSTRGPLATLDEPEIHSICVWLVNQGQAEWQEGEEVILLKSIARPQAAGKRSATTEAAAP